MLTTYGNVNDGRGGPLRGPTGRYRGVAGIKNVMVDGVSGGGGRGGLSEDYEGANKCKIWFSRLMCTSCSPRFFSFNGLLHVTIGNC